MASLEPKDHGEVDLCGGARISPSCKRGSIVLLHTLTTAVCIWRAEWDLIQPLLILLYSTRVLLIETKGGVLLL